MTQGAAFRGQPLLLLGALAAVWLALRVMLWQPPFGETAPSRLLAESAPQRVRAPAAETMASSPPAAPHASREHDPAVWPEPAVPQPLDPVWPAPLDGFGPMAVSGPEAPAEREPVHALVGHNLLLAAGLSQMEIPRALLAYLHGPTRPVPGVPAAAPLLAVASPPPAASAGSRWSADGWLLLRRDSTTPLLSGRPSYGRSQAGAVVRYRLAPSSRLRPQAYARLSTALAGAREQEVAAGVSARLLPGVPLRIAVEARVGETDIGTRLRPAAFAVTELPPLALPFGLRAETYAQAGYVGGDYATAFIDGQGRVERPLGRVRGAELSAGAGAWGGAQKGAARLDVGPTAVVAFRLGDARGRVAADYRFRVAGDAEPASGPALTLSAGF